jgi:hypothetical protein
VYVLVHSVLLFDPQLPAVLIIYCIYVDYESTVHTAGVFHKHGFTTTSLQGHHRGSYTHVVGF